LTLQQMKELGIDLKEDRIEFTFYEPRTVGGLAIGAKGETNVSGLFAAGDVVGNIRRGVSPAAYAIGWLAGESAAKYATTQKPSSTIKATAFIEAQNDFYHSIIERKSGATWQEAVLALQNLMSYYSGDFRYETLLKAGLAHLRKIRQRAQNTLTAKNPHELMRCLEALNLMDIGEAVMQCVLERKESRSSRYGTIARVDYPKIDEKMNKLLMMKLENGNPEFRWREPRATIK
ncbi:MAG: FAD-dependent oxidoreductase, partial [Dehalococcoidia bacterium]|nr:FAD-dependent oxidoreductase [Dehalococcoidia bacterium]